jgi:hypothetical protein
VPSIKRPANHDSSQYRQRSGKIVTDDKIAENRNVIYTVHVQLVSVFSVF